MRSRRMFVVDLLSQDQYIRQRFGLAPNRACWGELYDRIDSLKAEDLELRHSLQRDQATLTRLRKATALKISRASRSTHFLAIVDSRVNFANKRIQGFAGM